MLCDHLQLELLIQSQDYGRLWYLVIPPIMTFLDDYQVPYKLKGVKMVEELLQHVPREILKRTGVDGLILTVDQSVALIFESDLT